MRRERIFESGEDHLGRLTRGLKDWKWISTLEMSGRDIARIGKRVASEHPHGVHIESAALEGILATKTAREAKRASQAARKVPGAHVEGPFNLKSWVTEFLL